MNAIFATAISSAEAIARATVQIKVDRTRPSSTTYRLTGEQAAVRCKVNSLLSDYPPSGYGTCVSFDNEGAIVTRANSCD